MKQLYYNIYENYTPFHIYYGVKCHLVTVLRSDFITNKLLFYIRGIAYGDYRLYKSAIERLKCVK